MGKIVRKFLGSLLLAFVVLLQGCKDDKKSNNEVIVFGTSADAPPFEFVENGEMKGVDIELARHVAEKMGKKAEFKDMPFASLAAAVQSGEIDAIIASMNISEEKKKTLDFTVSYYPAKLAAVYKLEAPISSMADANDKKVACQLGANGHAAMISEGAPTAEIKMVDTLNQAVESLKAGHVDLVIMDEAPAIEFSKKNQGLGRTVVGEYKDGGYAIALKKGSELVEPMNEALNKLQNEGTIDKLVKKYVGNS